MSFYSTDWPDPVRLRSQPADPPLVGDAGQVYGKTISGNIELHYEDASGKVTRITGSGQVNAAGGGGSSSGASGLIAVFASGSALVGNSGFAYTPNGGSANELVMHLSGVQSTIKLGPDSARSGEGGTYFIELNGGDNDSPGTISINRNRKGLPVTSGMTTASIQVVHTTLSGSQLAGFVRNVIAENPGSITLGASVAENLQMVISGASIIYYRAFGGAFELSAALAMRESDPSVFAGGINNDVYSDDVHERPLWLITSSDPAVFTGIVAPLQPGSVGNGRPRRLLWLINVGLYPIYLAHENTGSVAANRMITATGQQYSIHPNGTACLWYNHDISRWRVISSDPDVLYTLGTPTVNFSGTRAVTIVSGALGPPRIAPSERQSGLRLPALGVAVSGGDAAADLIKIITHGPVYFTYSGGIPSGFPGRPLYVGSGGLIVSQSGFVDGASSGAPFLSGSAVQLLGFAISGGIFVAPERTPRSGLITAAGQGVF